MESNLQELKKNIEAYAKESGQEAWFYEEYGGVKGFLGTKDIIVLGLNPSSGKFPSKKDKLFYNLLKEKGFESAHLTDFIKIRAKNKEVKIKLTANPDLMKKQVGFFSEELSIIKPKLIITIGGECDKLLKQYFPKIEKDCKVIQIFHYSYNRFHKSSKYKSVEEVFEKISCQLDEIKNL